MPATKFPTINGLADMPMAKSEASENWARSRWSGDFVSIKDVLTSKSLRRVRVITVDLAVWRRAYRFGKGVRSHWVRDGLYLRDLCVKSLAMVKRQRQAVTVIDGHWSLLLAATCHGAGPEMAEARTRARTRRESQGLGSPETGVDSTKRTTTNQEYKYMGQGSATGGMYHKYRGESGYARSGHESRKGRGNMSMRPSRSRDRAGACKDERKLGKE
ncbi:hypothetical protein B0H14DRAFT_3165774 [Mycena olivaceomarginata]|nr:hypothetical protein B0H14DRAFT_3165774 [Mycena olivaceomarginata]